VPVEITGDRIEIRLAGEGGQGMILAGIILAEAAAIYDNKHAVQTQSYGPEARGGASKAEVIISEDEIDFPEVINADVLLALSQEACDKFASNLKKTGVLIVDVDQVGRIPVTSAIKLPITRLAMDATGKSITANVVALGVLVGLTGVVSPQAIEKAVMGRAPKGTEELNKVALAAGFAAAQAVGDTQAGRHPALSEHH
jgi:2-oxoglutarate ferredoxin oxidoreductase subunit gamma